MREKTCCFTGHRRIPKEDYDKVKERLEKVVLDLYNYRGIIYYGAGEALGFDTLAAETVLRLRESCPDIRLILVLPCRNQTRNWKTDDVRRYESIIQSADKVIYTSDLYTDGCMQKRNRRLVDDSSVCVCYQTQPKGGTAYTVSYAKDCGLEIINIAK